MEITEIRSGSKWKAEIDTSFGIGSHSRNPNSTDLKIPKGTILTWDGDAPNGNVWFKATIDGEEYRGKMESGSIINEINRGEISLFDNGNGARVYHGEYLQKRLK